MFAPFTRRSFEMLACKDLCVDGDPAADCALQRNVVDWSLPCWEGEHMVGVVVACVNIGTNSMHADYPF